MILDRDRLSAAWVTSCLRWVNSYTTFLIVYLGVISLSFTPGFVHAPWRWAIPGLFVTALAP